MVTDQLRFLNIRPIVVIIIPAKPTQRLASTIGLPGSYRTIIATQ